MDDQPMTAKDRAAVLNDLRNYRLQLAECARESRAAFAAMQGHAMRAMAAELAEDKGLADYHHRMAIRQFRAGEDAAEQRALLLEEVRSLERDLT